MTEFNITVYTEHSSDYLYYTVVHAGSAATLLQTISKNVPLVLKDGGVLQLSHDKIFAIEVEEVKEDER